MQNSAKKACLFLFLTAGVYLCYIVSGLVHQRILKRPYEHNLTHQMIYFNDPFLFSFLPALIAALLGKIVLIYRQKINNETVTSIPPKKLVICSMIIVITNVAYNFAIMYASFPAIVMIKSCSLLSVIIVAVFFSGVRDKKLKLTKTKLFIGLVATLGIVLFNMNKKVSQPDSVDHPISIFSIGTFFLLVSLIGDGFLPDFQAQIKSEYKPTSIEMYYHINLITALVSFSFSVAFLQAPKIFQFFIHCNSFLRDALLFSFLNGVGQLFIYRMITEFRQHIPAFVVAVRKCLTVVINILFFGHQINGIQIFGIVVVFLAVMWEVGSNIKKDGNESKGGENRSLREEYQREGDEEHQMIMSEIEIDHRKPKEQIRL